MAESVVSLRNAVRADLPSVIQLLADDELGKTREIVQEPPHECYVTAFEVMQMGPNQILLVADDGGRVVGCLQLSFIPGLTRKGMWRAQVEGVRVAKSHRGRGLGRALFEWVIAKAGERGCGLVQLTTDKARPDALAFYEALGFKASHEGMKLGLDIVPNS